MSEDGREVCFEEEVEKLRRSGVSAPEIAQRMGVDQGWVEGLISMSEGQDPAEQEKGPPGSSGGP